MNKIFAIVAACASVNAVAAVPLKWNVETSKVQPVMFEAVRGESLALEATFLSYGTPLAMRDCSLFWQTNGMKSAWWVAPAVAVSATDSSVSNIVKATFTAAMDPGAMLVNCFLGSTGENYRATFTIRYRNGPGATPNALPLPTTVIDCAKVTFLHPESAPFSGGGATDLTPATNYTDTCCSALAVSSTNYTDACCSALAVSSTNYTNAAITNHVTTGYLCTASDAQAMTNDATLIRWDANNLKMKYGNTAVTADDVEALPASFIADSYFVYKRLYLEGKVDFDGDIQINSGRVDVDISSEIDVNCGFGRVYDNEGYSLTDRFTADYTTNNLALVSTITNLAPSKARGISLHDPVRNCNWYQAVTNGVFYWLVEE